MGVLLAALAVAMSVGSGEHHGWRPIDTSALVFTLLVFVYCLAEEVFDGRR